MTTWYTGRLDPWDVPYTLQQVLVGAIKRTLGGVNATGRLLVLPFRREPSTTWKCANNTSALRSIEGEIYDAFVLS